MIFIEGPTMIPPHQIRIPELISVERVLASRGFERKSEGDGKDTILPRSKWTLSEANLIFDLFNNKTTRSVVLQLSEQKCADLGTLTDDQANHINQLKNIDDIVWKREAFSHTFEWYVGELFIRRFGASSSSYGVEVINIKRNSDGGTSGDFDVLSILGSMEMAYVECKSGDFSAKKITNMLERSQSLHASLTIMFAEKIDETALKQKLKHVNYPSLVAKPDLYKSNVGDDASSEIYHWHNSYFICSDNDNIDIEPKIRCALRLHEFKKANSIHEMQPDDEAFRRAGYAFTKVSI